MDGPVSVVNARRVRAGAERDFARWASRIDAVASRFPGFLGSDVQPPDDVHPHEWVTVFRFGTVEQLESYLSSPKRAELLEEAEPLIDGPVREQVIVEPVQASTPVTVVMSQRVRPDREADFAAAHDHVLGELVRFPGFLRSELVPPVSGVSDEHVIVFAFDSREHLDRWLASAERRAWLARIAPLISGDRTMNVLGGFAGWFPAPGGEQVPKWKQAVAVLLGLFPIALGLTVLRDALLPDLPLVPGVLLSNVLAIAVLTWLVMPLVNRVLRAWLHR